MPSTSVGAGFARNLAVFLREQRNVVRPLRFQRVERGHQHLGATLRLDRSPALGGGVRHIDRAPRKRFGGQRDSPHDSRWCRRVHHVEPLPRDDRLAPDQQGYCRPATVGHRWVGHLFSLRRRRHAVRLGKV
jgi:hypothetical protein